MFPEIMAHTHRPRYNMHPSRILKHNPPLRGMCRPAYHTHLNLEFGCNAHFRLLQGNMCLYCKHLHHRYRHSMSLLQIHMRFAPQPCSQVDPCNMLPCCLNCKDQTNNQCLHLGKIHHPMSRTRFESGHHKKLCQCNTLRLPRKAKSHMLFLYLAHRPLLCNLPLTCHCMTHLLNNKQQCMRSLHK